MTRRQVREVCGELVESYPAAWSRQATEDLDELTGSVLSLLHRLGLLAPSGADQSTEDGELRGEAWLLSPAAHRWAPSPDASPAPGREPEPPPTPEPAGWSLFDDMEEEAGR